MLNESETFSRKQENKSTSSNQKNPKIITILDFESNPTKKTKINSPRSLQAIKDSGHIIEELYYLTIDQYKDKNPNIRVLPQEIQKKRYDFYEKNRAQSIKEIIDIREIISNDEKTKNNFSTSTSQNFNKTNYSVKNEQREFERMKAKNEIDLINMVQYEIRREIMMKEAKRKIEIQNEKKEKNLEEIQKKRKEEEKKRIIREQKK